jgi:hypothetical protein
MERFVIERNIERFRALLKTEGDPQQRTAVLSLLSAEEQKLARLLSSPKDKSVES